MKQHILVKYATIKNLEIPVLLIKNRQGSAILRNWELIDDVDFDDFFN